MTTQPTSTRDVVDQILDEQRLRLGHQDFTDAKAYLERHPVIAQDPELAVDIIFNEFALLNEMGGQTVAQSIREVDPQDYLERFPEYAESLEKQFLLYFGIEQALSVQESPLSTVNHASKREDTENDEDLPPIDPPPRFKLREKLGEGGFATVFKAWDGKLKRWIAIKISKSVFEPNTSEFLRFEREANSAARLSHPAVVSVHEFGVDGGRPFIVSELMEGGSLEMKLKKSGVSYEQAASWLRTICEAVDYGHRYGVVHRDIKPANILFDEAGRPHLADFGLAALVDSEWTLTQVGDLLGTPAYMSPEQATGESQVGPPSDIYSLGVVLYRLICGVVPFSGKWVLQKNITTDPQPPRAHDPRIPLDLQTICLRALAKSPQSRYSSAREMGDDLGAVFEWRTDSG